MIKNELLVRDFTGIGIALKKTIYAQFILCASIFNQLFYNIVVRNKIFPAVKPSSIYKVESFIELIPVGIVE